MHLLLETKINTEKSFEKVSGMEKEDFREPVINDEIVAKAEVEKTNEIVALNDTDGSWKLDLGDGFHTQWKEITSLLTSSVNGNFDEAPAHSANPSIDDTIDITEDKIFIISLLGNTSSGKSFVARHLLNESDDNGFVNGPVCIDEAEKKGATTVNINCYLKKSKNNHKTIVLDYEGEKGSGFPLLHFAQRRLACVLRTAERAQQRRQAITDYFPKLAYILSNVVILIGNDDLASTDYLTRCHEFALKANDGVNQMVNRPMLIIVQNKGSLAQSKNHEEITKDFFDIHGQEAAALVPFFSGIKCFCLPHREQLQRTRKSILDGHEIFDQQMVDIKKLFSSICDSNSEQSLTHAQWLYLLRRVLPIVQRGKSVSLHTLLSEIVAPDSDQMIEIGRRCFLYNYDMMPIHSPSWFDYCCRFAVRIVAHFLAVQNYNRQELMSERVINEQFDKALEKLSNKLEEFQPCEALYTGKGRSSKNNDAVYPIYCYQHKGAHEAGHRTCQSVYGLSPWKEFFGWASADVWSGEFVSSAGAKYKNTIFSKNIVNNMSNMVKDLVISFRQDQEGIYDMFTELLNEEFQRKPSEILRRVCFCSKNSTPLPYTSHFPDINWGRSKVRWQQLTRRRLILGFTSCTECEERFDASWSRLISNHPSSTSQNSQISTKGMSECAICFDGRRDFLFVPCGHRGCCEKCADEIFDGQRCCPFCRAPISAKQRVHDV
ncbi:unnamed protein product [Adineta ricciae]|uniref:RING-type domain-containing protein n=1 Tax=Adineta ricciae TaxID=249248 RepID=A0A816BR99_ADIRI|nr:unnamed protein product [Adineta ricciae]CAF1610953.1 unnamed protein product [Adineta ricciae]